MEDEADLITRVDGFQADLQVCLANAGGNEVHVLPIVDKAEFEPAVDYPFVARSLELAGSPIHAFTMPPEKTQGISQIYSYK